MRDVAVIIAVAAGSVAASFCLSLAAWGLITEIKERRK